MATSSPLSFLPDGCRNPASCYYFPMKPFCTALYLRCYATALAFLLLFLLVLSACSRAQGPEFLSLELAVRLLPDEQRLTGTATLPAGPEAPVVFSLSSRGTGSRGQRL